MATRMTMTQFKIPKECKPVLSQVPSLEMRKILASREFEESFRFGQVYGEHDYSNDQDLEPFRLLFNNIKPEPTKFVVFMTRTMGELGAQCNVDFRVNDASSDLSNTYRYYFVTKGQCTLIDYTNNKHVLREGDMLKLPMIRSGWTVSVSVKPNEGATARFDKDSRLVCFTSTVAIPRNILNLVGSDFAENLVECDREDIERVDKVNDEIMERKQALKDKRRK